MEKIVVVGAGYVGLVTAACFAQKNKKVVVVENNKSRIDSLLKGQVPFYEPGLDVLLQNALKNNLITFVDHVSVAIKQKPQIIFSCVGTPSKDDGSADLSYVFNVASQIGQSLFDYCLIINKSTVPVGTAKKVKSIIKKELQSRKINIEFDVASNPEFLKEGTAVDDFMFPDRVVVGVESQKAANILKNLYQPFLKNKNCHPGLVSGSNPFLSMNIESAELTKYASNTMLATRISFMNQLALLAEKVGADIDQVKLGMSKDVRIGKHFLNAGIGYGGSCFPKDVKALIAMGKENKEPMTLFEKVDQINQNQRNWFTQKVLNFYNGNLKNRTIGIWGLSFKPETDDIRCAPSIDIIEKLLQFGAKIVAYDPIATKNIKNLFGDGIIYANSAKQVLQLVDALLILTEWQEFLQINKNEFKNLKDKVVFDGRNCFKPSDMLQSGIKYFSVGRYDKNEFLDFGFFEGRKRECENQNCF